MLRRTTAPRWGNRICIGLIVVSLRSAAEDAPIGSPTPEASPPRDVSLVEKKWEELSNKKVSPDGQKALAINPQKWRHAETENFVVNYRRVTEAYKVVREVEFDLWYVAKTLGAGKDRYRRKSHVYVFEDEAEWKAFVAQTKSPPWSASFALGDELFLNIRQATGVFDSSTLAHETTHAVVSRLYPGKRWPLWLNEGFAEYMSGASIAARTGQWAKGHQRALAMADLDLETLFDSKTYPATEAQVRQFYESSEKFVRFLMNELPKDRFAKFVDALLAGKTVEAAFLEIYGDKFKDFDAAKKKYKQFSK